VDKLDIKIRITRMNLVNEMVNGNNIKLVILQNIALFLHIVGTKYMLIDLK
jgi:hypothetical protein